MRDIRLALLICDSSIFVVQEQSLLLPISHQAAVAFRFLACPWSASSSGCSCGPQTTRNWSQENPKCMSAWDPDPKDPRGVPWDQIFKSKIFLISSSNNVILCILWIYWSQKGKIHEKLVIWSHFFINGANMSKMTVFLEFWCFVIK